MDVVTSFRQYYIDTEVRHTAQCNVDNSNHGAYLEIIIEKEVMKFQGQNRSSIRDSALREYEKRKIMKCPIFILKWNDQLERRGFHESLTGESCLSISRVTLSSLL